MFTVCMLYLGVGGLCNPNVLLQVDVHYQRGTQVATQSFIAYIAGRQPKAQSLVGQPKFAVTQ